ncbi:MAG: FAD-dependent oxidoreductase, partial [Armatimonadetes bacterium]|nr:FAD-dependent oxidoreductase [Armatimonadota bacterium]
MPAISVAIALLGGLTAPLPAEDSATVLLEAERFDQSGGWTIDAQFRRQMGSTYLLAAGMGQPVADATTTVQLPRDGSWRLWVRCKDWDATSPGAFQVVVNGQALGTIFGVQKRDWSWVDGGARDLAGSITLALRDLTGYYGRCDAILLTTDLNWTPPEEAAQLAALRAALAGQPAETVVATDFVVVGGGYGGVCAALQAARLGLRTVLLQNRPLLGGNASSEINVGPGGASPHTSIFRETGLPEEIAEGRVRLPEPRSWSASIAALCAATPNLTVYLNTEATEVIMARPGHLAAVAAEDVVSGRRYRFQAPLFADCTGDGTIAALAGAPFRVGQEARAEYGESHAPEVANPHTMGTSMMHRSAAMPTPQAYTPPAFAVKFTAEHFQHRHDNLANGTWWLEYGGMGDTIDDAEAIRDELLRVMYGAFDWAKNHDPATRQALANHKLVWVPTVAGKRESRRFIGQVVLTQHDVESGRLWPDRVAWGGWPIDLHPSEG